MEVSEKKLIGKNIKFTPAELEKILEAMRRAGFKEFSPYARKILLEAAEKSNK